MSSPSLADIRQKMSRHRTELSSRPLASLFDVSGRADRFRTYAAGLVLDFSKHYCTTETLQLFAAQAAACDLGSHIQQLFEGGIVNSTEQRPALHTALRSTRADSPYHAEVTATHARMKVLVDALSQQRLRGYSNQAITDVVNIGIGGSDLGPRFITSAIQGQSTGAARVHFVANFDPAELDDTLAQLDPQTTLFITASKSFSTAETLANTKAARQWLQSAAGAVSVDGHFIAVTANTAAATAFGIAAERIFPMWDWVGGRYSMWSAIGLPFAIAAGWDAYLELLAGAEAMDIHFLETPFTANMPALMAALECWYSDHWDAHSTLVMPYAHKLRLFPAYLQQLSMESLGKSVTLDGAPCAHHTGTVIWGEPGTNGQHSFMQLLHQGTRFIPVDFITVLPQHNDDRGQQLFANCLAQSRVLLTGKSAHDVQTEMRAQGSSEQQAAALAKHRAQPGSRPSSTLLMQALTPHTLGALIALYEHKVFVQSVLWQINAFDQWGVELGKKAASEIFSALGATGAPGFDESTNALIEMFRQRNS